MEGRQRPSRGLWARRVSPSRKHGRASPRGGAGKHRPHPHSSCWPRPTATRGTAAGVEPAYPPGMIWGRHPASSRVGPSCPSTCRRLPRQTARLRGTWREEPARGLTEDVGSQLGSDLLMLHGGSPSHSRANAYARGVRRRRPHGWNKEAVPISRKSSSGPSRQQFEIGCSIASLS